MRPFAAALAAALTALVALPAVVLAEDASPAIKNGSRVRIEYTLSDDGGKVLDTNKGEEPFAYTQGAKEIVPGLESALAGLHAGDVKQVKVAPEDGYGAVDPKAQIEVGRDRVPPDVKVGSELTGRAPNGATRPVRVKEVKDDTVVLDLNHPLAGKTLNFDVKILSVDGP
ncbi:MAG TPA: peptidylprolyl isomerase [Methylomirabilota bacterium]|jgi:FKBP-type peptidyl-prolyl cis-trans isomerase SlyD|nr:peptidylprolyl isomerase [Methylomirabilota bacterium]